MQSNRLQILLTILAGVFLLGTVMIFAVFALAPDTAVIYRPFLLTAFVVTLFISLVCIAWLLRGLLRPYSQLIGEARRAPVAHSGKTQNEAAFVLETFQSVIAQLQAQQKELERLSVQASARADSAERFSERIVASVPSGLIAFDGKGQSMVINGPGRALLDVDGNALGQPVRTLLRKLPRLAETVEECLETGRLYRREEIETVTGTGAVRRLGATIAPIDLSPDRGARGALCLLTDITEVMQLREQVALKRNLESLGEMSAGLAHEFKNTIATLHGYAQLLQNLDLNEKGKSAASSLLEEVRSLSKMITAFLNFARPQPLQMEDVAAWELLEECKQELEPIYQKRRVEIFLEGRDLGAARIRADARMLRQAILNLMRNAAEAIAEEEADRRVSIRLSRQSDLEGKDWIQIRIQDTGPGIPQSDLQRIFIPFFTTKAAGHGIGLALAHRVITEHGGSLMATNAPEGGAVFSIMLPAAQ